MLSKKQARNFFLGGTLVTFLAFIGLTIYSFSEDQDQSNYTEITEQVVRGKTLWETNNCMGCHTILGEGAYYAPELTKVLDRRGEGYVKAVLMTPVPWAPNGRKMVAYGFSEEEAGDLIAFFDWIDDIDLNGFDTVVSPLAKDKN
ncbi:nitric oxide reductase NorC subunit apoprotein [Aquimarina sp. MAR_2010_214]|uniref:c-type cytochrome n=1 Tax=Aquimarina sp. MAR_2010_214 TaxID=1250026 RepID=UPI000C6FE034|nr:cytochrome c [Aquimarina sp. MAR_2010_214]PKV51030.1 nitric oxide reductase NorC subunit apoprotein [Aquimarina sp. MAR_2010_214]